MARRLLWGLLVLASVTILARYGLHAGDVLLFVLAAAALVPLAWLIGEATEHAGEHTGPGIGGFLNASFGNAPELIIALFAVADGLPDVVRGSLTGSVVSNILLVLGVAMIAGGDAEERLDRRSLLTQLAVVFLAVLAFLIPAIPGMHGNPNRHSLAVLTIPVAIFLLALYGVTTVDNLRRHKAAHMSAPAAEAWSLERALLALAAATALTALVSEILVHSLKGFGESAGLSQFFIATVIVAIVGNAAEHGGAIVIARAGKMKLASEIAISSSAQVALLVAPAVMLLSLLFTHQLPLSFRWEELAAMAAAVALAAVTIADGTTKRWEGGLLVLAYGIVVAAFWLAGNR